MTIKTYNKLKKLNKEYLIEFIKSMENLPQLSHLETDDLSEEEIKKIEVFYDRWCNN